MEREPTWERSSKPLFSGVFNSPKQKGLISLSLYICLCSCIYALGPQKFVFICAWMNFWPWQSPPKARYSPWQVAWHVHEKLWTNKTKQLPTSYIPNIYVPIYPKYAWKLNYQHGFISPYVNTEPCVLRNLVGASQREKQGVYKHSWALPSSSWTPLLTSFFLMPKVASFTRYLWA